METRTPQQIRRHYEIEKELAARLRNASRDERKKLYSLLYEELFAKVPDHPLLMGKKDLASRKKEVEDQMMLLRPFLKKDLTFLEIGPGDCSLSFELCAQVSKVYAADVSSTITSSAAAPPNFQLILTDGIGLNLPSASIDFIYSNQLMEHLHPDDAMEQLTEIHRVLKPGGIYFCITPHRFMGPDDISKYFDKVATGFHLKEYTNKELYSILKHIGFSTIDCFVGWRGSHYRKIRILPVLIAEILLGPLPHSIRKRLAFAPFIRNLLYIKILAAKS